MANGAVQISISDRGPGIPADERPYVFDPFFRGRRAINDQIHGTGLGLHLVKQIGGGARRQHPSPQQCADRRGIDSSIPAGRRATE